MPGHNAALGTGLQRMTAGTTGRPRPRYWSLLLVAAAALSACSGTSTERANSTRNWPAPPPTIDQLARTAMPPADPGVRPRTEIDDDPNQVVGLFAPEVRVLLGAPVTVRRDIGAEIWQYTHADCVFDLFLYGDDGESDVGEPSARVTYFELRTPRNSTPLSERDGRLCFERLVLDELNGVA